MVVKDCPGLVFFAEKPRIPLGKVAPSSVLDKRVRTRFTPLRIASTDRVAKFLRAYPHPNPTRRPVVVYFEIINDAGGTP